MAEKEGLALTPGTIAAIRQWRVRLGLGLWIGYARLRKPLERYKAGHDIDDPSLVDIFFDVEEVGEVLEGTLEDVSALLDDNVVRLRAAQRGSRPMTPHEALRADILEAYEEIEGGRSLRVKAGESPKLRRLYAELCELIDKQGHRAKPGQPKTEKVYRSRLPNKIPTRSAKRLRDARTELERAIAYCKKVIQSFKIEKPEPKLKSVFDNAVMMFELAKRAWVDLFFAMQSTEARHHRLTADESKKWHDHAWKYGTLPPARVKEFLTEADNFGISVHVYDSDNKIIYAAHPTRNTKQEAMVMIDKMAVPAGTRARTAELYREPGSIPPVARLASMTPAQRLALMQKAKGTPISELAKDIGTEVVVADQEPGKVWRATKDKNDLNFIKNPGAVTKVVQSYIDTSDALDDLVWSIDLD